MHFYRADPDRIARSYDHRVRKATATDIPQMVELYRGYEFSRGDRTDDEIRQEVQAAMGSSGTYFIVESPRQSPRTTGGCASTDGAKQIVSAARIYPETDTAGLIGAARTVPACRGQGIYLSVRTACFEHLFHQGKTGLGMFVDSNTSMHRVIAKQGGTILAEWLIADVQPNSGQGLVWLRRRIIPFRFRHWATQRWKRV
jgi:predicted GNAT family acetyltransferase